MKLTLIQEKMSGYIIVFPHNAAPSERKAAEELSAYLEKISGVKLHHFTDEHPKTPYEILLGKTNRGLPSGIDPKNLGHHGFTIRTEGETLYLIGSDALGTL